ncbi:MAG: RNA polymerase sigma factor [Ignavibacteria bacterium]|nr:RNA polymerase sigma factor [Ignavibacteria bacterium]
MIKGKKEDFVLIDEFISGNRLAFGELIERYKQRIYSTAYRILSCHEDADDVTQEVIIKIYKSLQDFRKESSLFTWIYKMTVNLALNELKKKMLKNFFKLDDIENVFEIGDYSSPEINFQKKETLSLIQSAIDKLPEKQKLVFTLRFYEELKYDDISKILGTSVGALKANYFHALKKIAKELKDELR